MAVRAIGLQHLQDLCAKFAPHLCWEEEEEEEQAEERERQKPTAKPPRTGTGLSNTTASSLLSDINSSTNGGFSVGDAVECNYKGEGKWYPGKVVIADGGKYDILFDDGDSENGVDAGRLRMNGVAAISAGNGDDDDDDDGGDDEDDGDYELDGTGSILVLPHSCIVFGNNFDGSIIASIHPFSSWYRYLLTRCRIYHKVRIIIALHPKSCTPYSAQYHYIVE
jgi:hypothetical protein